MNKINREWHESNRMPKNPAFEQRLKWHKEHQKNCNCRFGYPEKLREEAVKRGIKLED